MYVIADSVICEEKMKLLRQGYTAYEESPALIKRLQKEISKENLHVGYDYTTGGCYFTPLAKALES
ncbi:hypothetical protein P5G51_007985 [Virgibacillus sp. 179-BFC.A HS]|uniref:Uncharacterized protein n=1 Tax=Tigheibacillus jepli TaxID=3035914 RepID=A0ABU5CG93_9BACI|nr:hypothetical protein [Virgibacillus sp. 179-BFC.A HS]MDY0405343.1 hypothetical protein [Virgibacillus sp. 179-BFC.A HS]